MLNWNDVGNYKKNTWHIICDKCNVIQDTKDHGMIFAPQQYWGELDFVKNMGWKTVTGKKDDKKNFIVEDIKHYCPNCKESQICQKEKTPSLLTK